ncbi:MAG: hypothetical protein ACN4GT_08915 [Gammaproteobacteria bacterium]
MTIEQWGAIGEIVGALAVVASLVYLAMQIRQNTRQLAHSMKATELAAFERNVDSGNRTRELFILHPDVHDLYLRGTKSFKALDTADRMRFGMILSNIFSSLQGAYIRQLTYGHDPNDFAGSVRTIDQLLKLAGVAAWLRHHEPDWRPEFAGLVQERMAVIADTGQPE